MWNPPVLLKASRRNGTKDCYLVNVGEANADKAVLLATSLAPQLGWKNSTPICHWIGVVCDLRGEVIKLALARGNHYFNFLNDTLPRTLADLTNLKELDLSDNHLTGTLPKEWATMSKLVYLDLGRNNLTGTLPGVWANMSQLETMKLGRNRFNGTLPAAWGNMSQLINLGLSTNNLTGTLPEAWANMSHLATLKLRYNMLNGTLPASWTRMSQLVSLALSSNSLTGPLPEAWSNMSQLAFLDFRNNSLTGPLPVSWAKLRNLKILDVTINNLTGTLPSDWSNMSQLLELGLDDRLKGAKEQGQKADLHVAAGDLEALLASPWASELRWTRKNSTKMCKWEGVTCNFLGRVRGLDLSGPKVRGPLPAAWANLSQLSWLDLRNCSLTGPLPAAWSEMSQLSSLALCQNQLTGALPADWAKMSQLLYLNLWENNLTGTLPARLANMSQLSRLELGKNHFTGTLSAEWANMSHLTWLDLGHNRLTGTIPAAWANLSNLTWVSLCDNNLTGTLPAAWADMTKLVSLELWNNSLTGPLPASWTNMSRLSRLDLSYNKLSGKVPNIGGVAMSGAAGRYIDLSNNSFTGSLPSTILNTSVLLLANNSLNGTLPETLEAPDLVMFSIGGNENLSAPVPDSWWMKENSCLPRVTILDVGHLMWDTAKDLTWKKQHCLIEQTFYGDDSGALEATLATVFQAQDKFKLPFAAQSLLGRIPTDTVPRMEDLCSNPRGVLAGAWGAFLAVVVGGFLFRGILRDSWQDLVVDSAKARGLLRILSDMAAAAAGAMYWFDLVTDVLQIKDVWGHWPAYLLLAFSVLSFAMTSFSMALNKRREEKQLQAGDWQADMGERTQLALAIFARVDDFLRRVSGRLGKVGTAVVCLPLAVLCLPLAVLCLPGACIFYCVSRKPFPDIESLIHGYDACNAILLGVLRMVLMVPLIPFLDLIAAMQYVFRDTGVDMLHPDEAYLERYSHMRDITKAVTTSLPTAILTSVIYARGNRPDAGYVYNPKIFVASLVGSLVLVLWAWLSTLYVVEVEAASDKAQRSLTWADFVRGIGRHVWRVFLGRTLGVDTGPQRGQTQKFVGFSTSLKPEGETAPRARNLVGSWGVRPLLRAIAIAAPVVGAILIEVYSRNLG